jgi:aminoglycoside/choline kinase family phosphotransferase
MEDEIVRGVYVNRAIADRMTVRDALERYLAEIPRSSVLRARYLKEASRKPLLQQLGRYSLYAVTPDHPSPRRAGGRSA